MHRRNLLVAFVLTSLCTGVPASAGQSAAPQQSKRTHAACPQKRSAAPQLQWSKQAAIVTAPIQISAGGLPSPSLRRFTPDLLP